jgi:Holliday junction resolvase RusA-like endonuclease
MFVLKKTVFGHSWIHMESITIDGEPVAKGRPRVTRTHTYTPAKTKKAQKAIKEAIIEKCKNDDIFPYQFTCPVYLEVRFYHKRPQRLMRKKDPDGLILKETKPDLDNLLKLVKDAINDSGWWYDDSHNTTLLVQKDYCAKGGTPKTIIDLYIKTPTED